MSLLEYITINNKHYYDAKKVYELDKLFFTGCSIMKIRLMIITKKLKEIKDYIYIINKKNDNILSNETNKKAILYLRKKWVDNNVPKFKNEDINEDINKNCKYDLKFCHNKNCLPCFKKSFQSSDASQYLINKDYKISRYYRIRSKFLFTFLCMFCNHYFKKSCDQIYHNKWCPYCGIGSSIKCEKKDCEYCIRKFFISHPKSKYWSNKNIEKPENVILNSKKKYWFKCNNKKCEHEFEMSCKQVNIGSWCSYCSNTKRCENKKCINCFKHSFASHPKSKCWSDKNKIKPIHISLCTPVKYWFKCDNENCNHEFKMKCADVVNGKWCPYCNYTIRKLCECDICFSKSIASHPKSEFLTLYNPDPRFISYGSGIKLEYQCPLCDNIFKMACYNITANKWCSRCVKKTELKLLNWLNDNEYNIIEEFTGKWCKDIICLRFDFMLTDYKTIIELDGIQHFEDVLYFKSKCIDNQNRDLYKMVQANKKQYSIIRIYQLDVFKDKNNWKEKLTYAINLTQKNKNIKRIYISSGDHYNVYEKLKRIDLNFNDINKKTLLKIKNSEDEIEVHIK